LSPIIIGLLFQISGSLGAPDSVLDSFLAIDLLINPDLVIITWINYSSFLANKRKTSKQGFWCLVLKA